MITNSIFEEYGIIDVTNFDTSPDNPELGYLCGGIISVLTDGKIIIRDANDGSRVLEDFHVGDLIQVNSNINSYDPDHLTEIALMIRDKSIRITFTNTEVKHRFMKSLHYITDD